ncbi:hypothetical protein C5167_044740 [Papaver somniferum]|nr:hypothetical protein C5167_044740 [Papaver somniferum]
MSDVEQRITSRGSLVSRRIKMGIESWDMDNGENIVIAGKKKKEGSARCTGPSIQKKAGKKADLPEPPKWKKRRRTATDKLLSNDLWVVHIESLWKEPDGSYWFRGRWYVIPEETAVGRHPHNLRRELYRTNDFADIEMESILRHCSVMNCKEFSESKYIVNPYKVKINSHFAAYKKYLETCGVLAGKPCSTMNEEDIFDFQDKLPPFPLGWIHVIKKNHLSTSLGVRYLSHCSCWFLQLKCLTTHGDNLNFKHQAYLMQQKMFTWLDGSSRRM